MASRRGLSAAALAAVCLAAASAQQQRAPAVFCHYLPWYTLKATADYQQARRGWCGVGAGAASQCSDPTQRQYIGAGPLVGEYKRARTTKKKMNEMLALVRASSATTKYKRTFLGDLPGVSIGADSITQSSSAHSVKSVGGANVPNERILALDIAHGMWFGGSMQYA